MPIPRRGGCEYEGAVIALQERLDPGGELLAVRHAAQKDGEPVADFLRRLFPDGLGEETRNTLLYSQMQEGLRLELMRAAAAGSYQALCLASKNEKRRLAERLQYSHARLQPHPILVLLTGKPQ